MTGQGHWHFRCPECGLGDEELGHLAADQELYCAVCLEETGRQVRLERWTAEGSEQEIGQARPRDGFAA
jgi:hypothetical protein